MVFSTAARPSDSMVWIQIVIPCSGGEKDDLPREISLGQGEG